LQVIRIKIFAILATIFIVVNFLTFIVNGSILVANDELKFYLLSTDAINYSDAKIDRTVVDFYGYYWLSKYGLILNSYFSEFNLKIISLVAHFYAAIHLRKLGYSSVVIIFIAAHPLLLFYGISGVRDSLASLLIVLTVLASYQRANILKISLIMVSSFLVRPELLIINIVIYFYLVMGVRKLVYLLPFFVFLLVLLTLQNYIQVDLLYLYLEQQISNSGGSSEGITSHIRQLTFPINMILLGFMNIFGSFVSPSTYYLDAIGNFSSNGVYFENPSFVVSKVLKVFGILLNNSLSVLVVFYYIKNIVNLWLYGRRLIFLDRVFMIGVSLLFLQGIISIELGKSSGYYYLIYPYIFEKLYNSKKKSILFLLIPGFFIGVTLLIFTHRDLLS
jgi:hypothetical protein